MAVDSLSDASLAEKLRREDPEQFHTLVRMHLSFVLDLNTDDSSRNKMHVLDSTKWKNTSRCTSQYQHANDINLSWTDCVTEKSKFKPLKWVFPPFAKKGKCSTKGVMEGAPLTQEGICQVYQLIEYLSKEHNICQEGIFRRTGKLTRQQELKNLLNHGVPLVLDKSHFSVHDCASVLKNFLAELPESLLTDAHYPAYCQIAEFCGVEDSESRLLRALQLLLLLLPSENRVLLRDVLRLLHLAASHEASNKMSADNLATLFTPHLLCPRKLSPEAFHHNSQTMSGVVAFMIRQGASLFSVPPKLATDIRAYWSERERCKLMPQKQPTDGGPAPANTVFSFVDRERTARAQVSLHTEEALAELYAHIQSLPESSNKKRLIKQFNKENGQGTPRNHHRSRSLGDSIKRHIPVFSKSARHQKCTLEVMRGSVNVARSMSEDDILDETMMTPRSRKPVVLVSGSNLCHLASWAPEKVEGEVDKEREEEEDFESLASESETGSGDLGGDSLTDPFRSYLHSRSILTATPVDLSFMSRTSDFDTSAEEKVLAAGKLSESLMRCLDGQQPSSSSVETMSGSVVEDSSPGGRKRSAEHMNSADEHEKGGKKSHLSHCLSTSAIVSQCKNTIRETSL